MATVQLPKLTKRVYPKSSRPNFSDDYPYAQRYFHKAFSDQGISADNLTIEQIEQACFEYSTGDRRSRQESDWYETYQFFDDFVHDDEKHNQLRSGERDYEPDFNDGDCRWSFGYVK